MFRKKAVLVGTSLVLMASFAAACGKANDTKPPASNGPSQVSDGIDEPTTLTFYNITRGTLDQFNSEMGNAIRKRFPNLTINYIDRAPDKGTDLAAYIPSGASIDLMWGSIGSWPGAVPTFDLGYDMTELIKKYNVDISRFELSLIDAMKQMSGGDKIFGLPISNSTNAIAYNKEIFDKFGVPYPKDGMTWDDLYTLATKLNREADGVQYTGWSPFSSYVILMNSYSVPMVDPKTQRSTYETDQRWPKIIESEFMRFARDPAYQKVSLQFRNNTLTFLLPDQFYKDKILAMTEGGPGWPISLKDQLKDMKWDFVSMPTYSDLPGVGQQSYPTYISIPNISKNKDAAMKVIKFLTSDEYQTQKSKEGSMTSLKSKEIQKIMGQEGNFKGLNYNAFFYNKFAQIANDDRVMASKSNALNAINWGAVMNGSKDMNTMLREAADKVNKAIDTANSK